MNTDEGTAIFKMALNVFIATIILASISGLVYLAYSIWNMFSREDSINKENQDYATYAAFDNRIVEGQELVSLITNSEGLPVVILEGESSGANPYVVYYDSNYINASQDAANEGYTRNSATGELEIVDPIVNFADASITAIDVVHDIAANTFTVDSVVSYIKSMTPTSATDTASGTYGTWHAIVYYENDTGGRVNMIRAEKVGS